jgi:uncharacterized protein YjiS (DUF1127 family)
MTILAGASAWRRLSFFVAAERSLHILGGVLRALLHRHELTQLAEKDDHLLSDMGVSRGQLERALACALSRDPSVELASYVGRRLKGRAGLAGRAG